MGVFDLPVVADQRPPPLGPGKVCNNDGQSYFRTYDIFSFIFFCRCAPRRPAEVFCITLPWRLLFQGYFVLFMIFSIFAMLSIAYETFSFPSCGLCPPSLELLL